MSVKIYQLELTADEVQVLNSRLAGRPELRDVRFKLAELERSVAADRDATELRLPWRATPRGDGQWYVELGALFWRAPSEALAKRMSAAPELLEAVKEVNRHVDDSCGTCPCCLRFCADWVATVQPSIDRALRKVETGQPEEP